MAFLGFIYLVLLLLIFALKGEGAEPFTIYPKSPRGWGAMVLRVGEFFDISLGLGLTGIREWGSPPGQLILLFMFVTAFLFALSVIYWFFDRELAKNGLLISGICMFLGFTLVPCIYT